MTKTLLAFALIFVLSACDDGDQGKENHYAGGGRDYAAVGSSASSEMRMMAAPSPAMAPQAAPSDMVLDRSSMGDRKIAETHSLSIETAYDKLQARYQRDFQACVKMGCQIINSNISSESNANLQARIAPDKLGAFLDFLAQGEGKIESHQVSADDYTMEYSDVNASIENLTRLRDRLATLLNTRAESVEDILRIEQELGRIQTQLDQNTARLRILQKMTQMATLNLNYTVQYRPADIEPYELNNTWKSAANQFMRAIDRMIQFTFAALPWIPVLFIGFWLGVRAIRFAFGKAFINVRLPWRKQP